MKTVEEKIAHKKQYYIENKKRIKAQSKKWHEENAERKSELNKQWYFNNFEYTRIRHNKIFNFTLKDYNNMLTQQVSGCTICGKTIKENGKALAIDHDHKTGKVRALLCSRCNLMLGIVNDNLDILKKAVEYLEKYNTN
jgi:hypothetical protein